MSGDREYLEVLGAALSNAGWSTQIRDNREGLRLLIRALPEFGETVTVACEPLGPWFRGSRGNLIAPCTDIPSAAAVVDETLRPFVWSDLAGRRPVTAGAEQ